MNQPAQLPLEKGSDEFLEHRVLAHTGLPLRQFKAKLRDLDRTEDIKGLLSKFEFLRPEFINFLESIGSLEALRQAAPKAQIGDNDKVEDAIDQLARTTANTRAALQGIANRGAQKKLRQLFPGCLEFDLRYDVNTLQFKSEEEYRAQARTNPENFSSTANVDSGVKHRPSLTPSITGPLQQVVRILSEGGYDHRKASFFDLGSGASKPGLIARHPDFGFNFKRAVSVDYDIHLLAEGAKNASESRMGVTDMEFFAEDADEFHEFNGLNVVYMYNPFDETVMARVEQNLRKYGGQVMVVYTKPLHIDVFAAEHGWEQVYSSSQTNDPDSNTVILSRGFD